MKCYPHKYPENIPILYRNIMDILPSDFARDVFLWAVERPGEDRMCYRAERLAEEADRLFQNIRHLLNLAAWSAFQNGGHLLLPDQQADLEHFFMVRWSNWRFGGNASLPASAMPRDGGGGE